MERRTVRYIGLCLATCMFRIYWKCLCFLIVAACCAPQPAVASCGDYLYTRHSRPHHAVNMGGAASGELRPTESDRPQDPAAIAATSQRSPCSGPNCRQSPESPAKDVPATFSPVLPTDCLAAYGVRFSGCPDPVAREWDRNAEPGPGYPLRQKRPPQAQR